jgi:hypothetical protein
LWLHHSPILQRLHHDAIQLHELFQLEDYPKQQESEAVQRENRDRRGKRKVMIIDYQQQSYYYIFFNAFSSSFKYQN